MKLTSYGLIIVYSSCLYILWNNDLSAFYLLNTICSGTSACDYKVNGKHDIAKKISFEGKGETEEEWIITKDYLLEIPETCSLCVKFFKFPLLSLQGK